jgi:hypothetical protein
VVFFVGDIVGVVAEASVGAKLTGCLVGDAVGLVDGVPVGLVDGVPVGGELTGCSVGTGPRLAVGPIGIDVDASTIGELDGTGPRLAVGPIGITFVGAILMFASPVVDTGDSVGSGPRLAVGPRCPETVVGASVFAIGGAVGLKLTRLKEAGELVGSELTGLPVDGTAVVGVSVTGVAVGLLVGATLGLCDSTRVGDALCIFVGLTEGRTVVRADVGTCDVAITVGRVVGLPEG